MTNNVENIELGGKGIKSILKKYTPEEAIAEFVWNGFDAKASEVRIDFEESSQLGGVSKIIITDNGYGIPQESLKQKFKPFFESEKANADNRHYSLTHGKSGIGRLTFFTFAKKSTWVTCYKKNGGMFKYHIEITSNNLESYRGNNPALINVANEPSGTTVIFEDIYEITRHHLLGQVTDYLKQEFGWFLELFKAKGFSLKINGEELDYSSIVGERESVRFLHQKASFDVSFIRWNVSLQTEYSKFYLVDSRNQEVWKDTTKLNNKGDNFYHSVYVKSIFFDGFIVSDKREGSQTTFLGKSKSDEEYKFLEEELTNYLRKKRKPFLKEFADQLVQEYEKEGIIPEFKNTWEQPRKQELEEVVKGLYQIQPKIFSASSSEQKKTFVRFLNALLCSDEREQILAIINEVVDLDFDERKELLGLLQATKLSSIIRTIKLITDRYTVVDQLKELVFNENLKANERDHLQKILDQNYWLFGEQFHLVTSTEAKFEKALREYTYVLTGEAKSRKIDHRDKNKEMDIFLCKQNKLIDTIENIVVELKSPSVSLGKKEADQVIQYMQVILKQPEFNAKNMDWQFYLIGNKLDGDGWIEQLIETNKPHGEARKGLIHSAGNYKIYARTWSHVLADFECRHKFLEEKLSLERDSLSKVYGSADEILEEALK